MAPSPPLRDRWLAVLPFVALAVLLAVPVLGSAPLVHDSFWIDYVWAGRFHAALAGGTVYPRWLDGSFGGLGAPVFYFYAPIAFYAVAALIAIGLPAYSAVIAAFILFHAASGIAMRHWLGGRGRAATGGALLYMLLPYHLVDFHRRGALAEFAAYALIPLLARAIVRAGRGRSVAPLALAYAGLIMTHLPTALLASVLLIPPLALHRANRPRLPAIALGLLLGIGLASVYLLPALTLQRHTNMPALWANAGLTPAAWRLTAPDRWVSSSAGLVFAMLEIALAIAALGLLRRGAAFWPAVALFAALVAANLVPGFWALPMLAKVQFPWRALTIAEFAIATAFAQWIADPARPRRSAWALAPALILAVPVVLTPFAIGHPTLAALDRDAPDVPEYLPASGTVRSSAAAEALARTIRIAPDGDRRDARFWFPGVMLRCGDRIMPARPDPRTALVRHPAGAGCVFVTGLTLPERIGWALSALALALTIALARMHPCRARRVMPSEPVVKDIRS